MKIYFYDRVPYSGATPTNLDATIAGGNSNVSLSPVTAAANTAQPGEPIYGIRLECTGYSCLVTDDTDGIGIRYYGRRPGPITVANAPAELCRNTSYALNISPVFDANTYIWSASNGAAIAPGGTAATLSLSNVPPAATSITVSVIARNSAGNCGLYNSPAQTITLPLARSAAQPQGLTLSNGLCPTSNGSTKTVSVTAGTPGTMYAWTVNGAGATILGASQGADLVAVPITADQVGTLTVSVRAKSSECGGFGPALTQTFQIGNVVTVAPAGITKVGGYCSADYWCFDHSNSVVVNNPQPGLVYRMFINNVVPAETNPDPFYRTRVLQVKDGAPSGDVYLSGSGVRSFDLVVTTENPCPAPGTPATSFFSKTYNIVPVNGDNMRTSNSGPSDDKPLTNQGHNSVLYPNPTTGTVNIVSSSEHPLQWIKVLDAQGRIVSEQHATKGVGITSFELKMLATGLYQVQLFNGQKLIKERLMKQ